LKSGEIEGITWEEQLEDAVDKSVLTAEEAAIMNSVRAQVLDIIAVDEFDVDELRLGQAAVADVENQHAA
jgi:hypothetical protein